MLELVYRKYRKTPLIVLVNFCFFVFRYKGSISHHGVGGVFVFLRIPFIHDRINMIMLVFGEKMNYYNVGKIVNTQGLQGEMRVMSVTDFAEERFKKGSILALFDKKEHFVMNVEIASHRKMKNFDIVKFKGMYHINDIEKYRDFTLKVAEQDLSDLDEGEFYYHEIIGLNVYEQDILIGTIKEILQPGANDVWVVKRKGKRDLLLPYIPPVVLNIDFENSRVDVEIPEGLDDED